jgi:hypothetical protein
LNIHHACIVKVFKSRSLLRARIRKREIRTKFRYGDLLERGHFRDAEGAEKMKLIWILGK